MNELHVREFEVRAPSPLLVRVRDKFLPSVRLALKTSDGILPYDRSDLVATGLVRGSFERSEIIAVTRILPACQGVVDVGANLGLYTLMASRRMAPRGRVVAFEASPIELEKLCWTVRQNGLANVDTVHAAVSDSDGQVTMYQSAQGAGALNRIDRPAKPNGRWEPVTVPMASLDSWYSKVNSGVFDLIKIDVEGHELPVLHGARELLARDKPLLMIEVSLARASERSHPDLIWDYMIQAGYRWYGLSSEFGKVLPVDAPGQFINLFAVPNDPRNSDVVDRLLSN